MSGKSGWTLSGRWLWFHLHCLTISWIRIVLLLCEKTTVYLAAALVVLYMFFTFLHFSSRVTTKFWAKASCPSSPWLSRPSSSADGPRRRSRQWEEPVCWWHSALVFAKNKLFKWEGLVSVWCSCNKWIPWHYFWALASADCMAHAWLSWFFISLSIIAESEMRTKSS